MARVEKIRLFLGGSAVVGSKRGFSQRTSGQANHQLPICLSLLLQVLYEKKDKREAECDGLVFRFKVLVSGSFESALGTNGNGRIGTFVKPTKCNSPGSVCKADLLKEISRSQEGSV